MAFIKPARIILLSGMALLFMLSSTGAMGLTSWNTTESDFNGGEHFNIRVENGSLAFALDYSLGCNWTKREVFSSPPARANFCTAFDRLNKKGIIFGGSDDLLLFNDTWMYDAITNKWTDMKPLISPPGGYYYSSICYDEDDGLFILFGGRNIGMLFEDTWTYNLSSNTWTNLHPKSSPGYSYPFSFPPIVYDNINNQVILFGAGDYQQNETWSYNITTNVWTNHTLSVAPPDNAEGCSMVYDERNRLVIFFQGTGTDTSTWVLDPITFEWNQRMPVISPSHTNSYAATYDSSRAVTMLFGGYDINFSYLAELWTYNATINTWMNITPVISPPARAVTGLFYDSNMDAAVLFGGWDMQRTYNDTWIYTNPNRIISGKYTSNPWDTGGNAYFGTLQWTGSIPIDTYIKFQFRTCLTQENINAMEFTGPDGTSNSYFNVSGQRIPSMHNGSRWLQYCVFFTTNNALRTPMLSSVTVNYNLIQRVTITSPLGGINWTGTQSISWSASNTDNDSLLFDIYLINLTGSTQLVAGLSNATRQWLWDTNGIPNGTYQIRIVARDENPSIPLTANTTSDYFIISHPGPLPTILPTCKIISPTNGSKVSGRILIRGTVAGDRLPIISVFVRIDSSEWKSAFGLYNWSLQVDTASLAKGEHKIEVRAYDGSLYSETEMVIFFVANPDHSVSLAGYPFYLPAIIIVVAAGIYILFIIQKKKGY